MDLLFWIFYPQEALFLSGYVLFALMSCFNELSSTVLPQTWNELLKTALENNE